MFGVYVFNPHNPLLIKMFNVSKTTKKSLSIRFFFSIEIAPMHKILV